MKKNYLLKLNYHVVFIFISLLLFLPGVCRAMPPGTLLYRTSNDGKMFGYSNNPLFVATKGIVNEINSGHTAIYVGKIDGEDYIVEALGGGIVKTPAKYFVNTSLGEKFLGAKIPKGLNSIQQAKVVALANNIAEKNLGYDFDFKKQKGPDDGEWTCVGLTEKIYESANISNPNNFNALEYDPNYYALNITPDGYDNNNVVNSYGDCFAKDVEFSKIARRTDLLIPAPELIGYDAGLEYEGDRYIFLPYTQFVQPSLDNIEVDISISDSFNDKDVRASAPSTIIALRWSLINNPLSSLKMIANKVKEVALNITDKIFKNNETAIVLNDEANNLVSASSSKADTSSKKATTAKKTTSSTKATASKTSAAKTVSVKSASSISKAVSSSSVKKETDSKTIASTTKASSINKPLDTSTTASKTTSSKTAVASKTVARLVSVQPTVSVKFTSTSNSYIPSSNSNSNIVNIASTPTNNTTSNNSNSASTSTTSSNTTIATTTVNTEEDWPKIALIKRIYSTGDNNFVELFNPTDHDFDLKTAEYRLAKTKTSVTPSLLMRIGNPDDGSYPGGTIIKAHDLYMIVRDDASIFYKDRADAISTRDEFTWPGNGYTLYLGNGAISSNEDPNIVDAVGFGNEATYFLGDGPAPEIIDNYILTKTASTSNNAKDFSLLLSEEPGLIATSSEVAVVEENAPDWEKYLSPTPINSDGLTDLWHFDECYGSNIKWGVGKWGCALELDEYGSSLADIFSSAYDLDNLSFSFDYKRNINSRIIVEMGNSFNEKISLLIQPGIVQVDGLPNTKWQYYQDYMPDNLWHRATLVVSRADQYWALYIDGKEKIKENFTAALPDMENFKVWSNQGKTLVDEFAVWPRVLSSSEIENDYNEDAPYSPVNSREAQKAPILKHFWHFDEGHGSTSLDNIGGLAFDIPNGAWLPSGRLNTALLSKSTNKLSIDLDNSIRGKDYSLSFWWRNSVYPNDGRAFVGLRKDNKNLFGFNSSYFRNNYWFNNNQGIFHEGIGDLIPYDNLWHHLALTYDSYRYSLNFYVDGEEKASSSLIWLEDDNTPNRLQIENDSEYSDIDELGVWQGTLSAKQVQTLFNDTPNFQ